MCGIGRMNLVQVGQHRLGSIARAKRAYEYVRREERTPEINRGLLLAPSVRRRGASLIFPAQRWVVVNDLAETDPKVVVT